MQLEFHQPEPALGAPASAACGAAAAVLASLAESGQQTPHRGGGRRRDGGHYVVIDGYKRIAALEQLGRDRCRSGGMADERGGGRGAGPSLRLSEHENRAWRWAAG